MSAPRLAEHPVLPLFLARWSPRAFDPAARLDDATLARFFEAARWAPSGYNAQPWRFVHVRPGHPGWGPFLDRLAPFNRDWAQHASALVAVISATQWTPPGKDAAIALSSHAFDAGAAWLALALQATTEGWHAHGIGGFDAEGLRELLGVPADHALQAVVALGRPGDLAALPEALRAREAPTPRRPQADWVAEGRFSFPG